MRVRWIPTVIEYQEPTGPDIMFIAFIWTLILVGAPLAWIL